MNILDENIPSDQRQLIQKWRIPIHQIGFDAGRKGMLDDEIIPLLHLSQRPTFFTRDDDFYDNSLCHKGYCLVYLNVAKYEVAHFVRRLLRHPDFKTKVKRMGCVIRISHPQLTIWRLHAEKEVYIEWT